uniref:Ferric uptake regulation protein n=1 Tax=candidate division WOR-3 bacterium TaxID=2052148 RepID=A0A7V0Z4N4_UNCW3
MNFKIKNNYNDEQLARFRKKYRLKSSQKRQFIINYFLNQDKHLSVEELYNMIKNKVPKIGYSTVYRTLKLLAECGIVSIRHFEKGITRFEPIHKKQHHDHLICTRCGAIIEFINQEIEKIQKRVARKYNFSVLDHKLEIYGLCLKCARKEKR